MGHVADNSSRLSQSEPGPKRQTIEKRPRSSLASELREYMEPSVASSISPRTVGKTASKVNSRLSGLGHAKSEDKSDDSGVDSDVSRDDYQFQPSSPSSQKRKRHNQPRSKLASSNGDFEDDDKLQTARGLVWLVLVALTMSWWVWYAAESRAVGYCDVGRHSNALLDERARAHAAAQQAVLQDDEHANGTLGIPSFMRPTCVPCPPHSQCQRGMLVGCESNDYVLQPSVLSHLPLINSMASLSMTAPVCRPDEQKLVLASDLADAIEHRLRIWKGNVQCKRENARYGGSKDSKEETSDLAYSLPKDQLHEQLKEEATRGSALSKHPPEYFEELWDMAVDDLRKTDRIQEGYRGQAIMYAKRGAVGVGIDCQVRLLAESVWQRIRLWLGMGASLLLAATWLRHRLRSGRIQQGQTKELVASALTRLEQAKRHASQAKTEDGFLSISQLRDDILRHESSDASKKKMWLAVSKVVEANANVRTRQAKVKGEWSRVWEWVGALNDANRVKSRSSRGEVGEAQAVNMGKERLQNVEV